MNIEISDDYIGWLRDEVLEEASEQEIELYVNAVLKQHRRSWEESEAGP